MATDTDQQVENLARSSFSIEDWDRPTTPKASGVSNGARRLAELLQKHAEDGKAVELTPEDEAKLSEELAAWINEPDDDWFQQKADEIRARKGNGNAATT